MQTYSHSLITAVANRGLKTRGLTVPARAFLLGSVMPDVPLLLLSLGYLLNRYRCGLPGGESQICEADYDNLYFHNPWWITGHSLFHAPLHIAIMLAVGYYFGLRQKNNWALALFWFAVACGGHALIDIFTHHDDGPLLFFPFNWSYRFSSPVSYWDSRHGGRIFAPVEHLLDLAILVYFAIAWFVQRKAIKNQVTK